MGLFSFAFREKKTTPLWKRTNTKTLKTFLKRRIVMKKLNNTWKMVIGLSTWGVCLAVSYFAGQMVGEVVGEWAANKLLKEG